MSTVAAPSPSRQLTIRDQLRSPALLKEIASVVPQHMKPERMVRVALTALTRTPELANCDQSSFFRCLLDLSQWGLEPDGRHAHLIPFRNNKRGCTECQLIIDYKGLVQLAFRSGYIRSLHADVVHAGDLFVYNRGDVDIHTPWYLRTDRGKPAESGEIIAAYCRVELKDGAVKCEALSKAEIDGIRARSKAGRSGPWVTDYAEMAKKTAFRRLSKWIPLSAEIVEAFERDDDRLENLHALEQLTQQPNGIAGLKHRLEHSATPEPKDDDQEGIDPPHSDDDAIQDYPAGSATGPTAEELADQEREARERGELFDNAPNYQ